MRRCDSLNDAFEITKGILTEPANFIAYKPYLSTTQNLSYVPGFLKENEAEKAYVILGAGDIVFQVLACGIKNITAVDLNPMQSFVFALKKAAMISLDANDFYNFLLNSKSKDFLTYDMFKKIERGFAMSEMMALEFWKNVFSTSTPQMLSKFFFKGGMHFADKEVINASLVFLNPNTYNKTKENLLHSKIDVINDDALKPLKKSDETYDYIDFTNILLFILQTPHFRGYNAENIERFIQKLQVLQKIYSENLRGNGTLVLDYMFGISRDVLDGKENIYTLDIVAEHTFDVYRTAYAILTRLFPELKYEEIKALSQATFLNGKKDSVFYLKR